MKKVTKKQYNQAVMPPIYDIIEGKYKVLYINYGKLRFTASYVDKAPNVGSSMIWDSIQYKVSYVNEKEKRFSAVFVQIITEPQDVPLPEDTIKTKNVATLI